MKQADNDGDNGHKNKSVMFCLRLSRKEMTTLEKAARAAGLSLAEYIRKAVAMRPHRSVLVQPQIGWVISTPYFQYGSQITWSQNPEYQVTSRLTVHD